MKCNKNARWVIKNIIVDPHFGARFHALSCNLFCQVSQPQEATWHLLIGCYGIRYCFLKSYQEATPGGGYAGGVQSLLKGERLLEVVVFCRDGWRGKSGYWKKDILREKAERKGEGGTWATGRSALGWPLGDIFGRRRFLEDTRER